MLCMQYPFKKLKFVPSGSVGSYSILAWVCASCKMAKAGNASAEDVAADVARWAVLLAKSWFPPFSSICFVSGYINCKSLCFTAVVLVQGSAYNHRNSCRSETPLEGMAKLRRW